MATQPVYQFLDDRGVQEVIDAVLDVVEQQFDNTMVTEITPENATDDVIPSAKAVLDFVASVDTVLDEVQHGEINEAFEGINQLREYAQEQYITLMHLRVAVVPEGLDSIMEPRSDRLYLHPDPSFTSVWYMSVYTNQGWITVGKSDADVHCWRKDNNELEQTMIELAITPMTFNEIKKAVLQAALTQNILDDAVLDRIAELQGE